MFKDIVEGIPANCLYYGDYYDGFYRCRDEASVVVERADELINKLFNRLTLLGEDSLVLELKKEYGI